MEFDFSVNAFFRDPITLITGDSGRRGRFPTDHEVKEVINVLGERSAQAQKLSSPITTWSKLQINKHSIYLLTDPTANNGRGHVLGFIKLGKKQLFVLDCEGTHNEMHPLCVLDFYIHESVQRKGHGLKLFRHMLQAEGVYPAHLAIDRPSSKFISFLRKHFHLWATIPQVNNFVVFEGFFKNRKDKPRHARKTNKDFEDDFRPLSRTFSEDVIRRNRRNLNYSAGSLSGVRPMSGFASDGSGDRMSEIIDNSSHMARNNRFSRFAADENYYAPSTSRQCRKSLRRRQDEEIVTNPFRRETNTIVHGREVMESEHSRLEQNSEPLHEIQPSDEAPSKRQDIEEYQGNCDFSEEKTNSRDGKSLPSKQPEIKTGDVPSVFISKHAMFESKGLCVSSGSTENEPDKTNTPSSDTIFQGKVGYTSVRHPSYAKPSDMISELKQKDLKARNSSGVIRPPTLGTSWNLFGVPSPSWRRWPN